MIAKVSIIMAALLISDYGRGLQGLNELKIPFEVNALSAHRTPAQTAEFPNQPIPGIRVFIAGAGGAAHYPV